MTKTLFTKFFSAGLIVMLALAALPVTPARAAACMFTSAGNINWNATGVNTWTITGGAGCPASGSAYPGNTVGNTLVSLPQRGW